MLILVLAKEPLPGRVKTRLCPPCSGVEAAELAAAALADTLEAAAACGADRRVLALDGNPGPWLPAGFEVIPQRGAGLAERLAAAWTDADGPGVQIGMDTPQVTATDLNHALASFDNPLVDAALGLSTDGGWWAIGLREPDPRVFLGVPMSSESTGRAQAARLVQLGLRYDALPEFTDVDTFDDALRVAAAAPLTRFAAAVNGLHLTKENAS